MTRDYFEIIGNEDGIGEAKPLNRILDQLELLAGMRPGIARIGPASGRAGRTGLQGLTWQKS
jgi:hypothetical protein